MFIRAANPIWLFVDLVGNILDDSYYMSTLSNVLPYTPQSVYMDNQGIAAWSNPIFFNANGTLDDNLYFNVDLVYRLEIRQLVGLTPSQSDPLIYEINDFQPGVGIEPDEQAVVTQENQISNPQFSIIDFVSPLVITTAGTYDIAPGWSLVLTGTGSVSCTVTQFIEAGNQNQPNNPVPPYYLEINTAGWSTAVLQQTFNGVGAIWANEFVAMSILARSNDGIARSISLSYVDNLGNTVGIETANLTPSVFNIIQGLVAVPTSSNSTLSNVASVSMEITLPSTGIVDISNVEVWGQTTSVLPVPATTFNIQAEETIERQTDHLFHYYKNSIIMQPKDSILVGWNFGLNPWQFTATGIFNLAANQYTADQTIAIQQNYVSSAVGNNIATGRGAVGLNYSFQAQAVTSTNQFAIVQYIDPTSIRPYWGNTLSSLVIAQLSRVNGATTPVTFKMRLIVLNAIPNTTSQNYPIASWAANGEPVFDSSFTVIKPLNDPMYTLPLNQNDTFSFNQFILPISTNANMTLGIVIYTINSMSIMSPTADSVLIKSISLAPNSFAISSNPKTYDQTLRECQYYYAKTFNQGVVPAQALSDDGTITYRTAVANATAQGGMWFFPTTMRSTSPTLTSYSPTISGSAWWNANTPGASGAASFVNVGDSRVFISNAQISGDSIGEAISIHATADARIG